jgi:hypothetical protein
VNAAEAAVRRLRRQGRLRRVTVSWRALRRYAERDGWLRAGQFYAPHVEHVSARKPGIIGTLAGRGGRRFFLLEGMHRAVRCLRERRPFIAYVLPKAETDRITLTTSAPHRHARTTLRARRAQPRGRRAFCGLRASVPTPLARSVRQPARAWATRRHA